MAVHESYNERRRLTARSHHIWRNRGLTDYGNAALDRFIEVGRFSNKGSFSGFCCALDARSARVSVEAGSDRRINRQDPAQRGVEMLLTLAPYFCQCLGGLAVDTRQHNAKLKKRDLARDWRRKDILPIQPAQIDSKQLSLKT